MDSEITPEDSDEQQSGKAEDFAKRITLRRGQFEAEIKNLPASVMEALYHEITGKKEKLSFFIPDPKTIDFAHLSDLVTKIEQNTRKYKPTSTNMTVEISYLDGRRFSFSSWMAFARTDFRTRAKTGFVHIKFDFLMKSSIDTFNSYSISVILDSSVGIGDFFSEEFRDVYQLTRKDSLVKLCEVNIEYIDSLVARDYWAIINEWYKDLPDVNHGIDLTPKTKRALGNSLSFIVHISPALPFLYALQKSEQSISINQMASYFVWAFVVALITVHVGRFSVGYMMHYLDGIANLGTINLTRGDQESVSGQIRRNRRKLITAAAWFWGVISALGTSIFSSFLYDYIK
ncbi:hypothetical protein [Agrobacterium pusense]|uniref:hypothetical protein n=1 Tax=Agrobacterium pusense TaxID=648995 RepID=UPI002FDD331D